jgi:16S rRNA (uracil1498-N3)-methyltransferase
MTIPHLFLPPKSLQEEEIVIQGERAFYLLDVLRLRRGERVYLMDGEGAYFLAELTSASKGKAVLKIIAREWRERKPPFIISAIPILKGDKTETAIRALSQMGISTFFPFTSERTIVKLNEKRKRQKEERWQKLAMEEAELSCSPFYPQIKYIRSFKDVFNELSDVPILIAYEEATREKGGFLYSLPDRIALITGPEGGFSEREIEFAKEKGAFIVSLGENIISAEFAPIVFATLILFFHRFDIPLRVL